MPTKLFIHKAKDNNLQALTVYLMQERFMFAVGGAA